MNAQQLELTRLIGKKELSFGCVIVHPFINGLGYTETATIVIDYGCGHYELVTPDGISDDVDTVHDFECYGKKLEIIGHLATLSDFHRWLNDKNLSWEQSRNLITINWYNAGGDEIANTQFITYDSYKDLLDQSEKTLKQLIELITSYQ